MLREYCLFQRNEQRVRNREKAREMQKMLKSSAKSET